MPDKHSSRCLSDSTRPCRPKRFAASLATCNNFSRTVVTRWQTSVLGQDAALHRHCGLHRHRRRILAPRALITAIDQRLKRRNQVVFSVADQIGPAHGFERLAQQRPVVRVVVAQEGLVQATAFFAAHPGTSDDDMMHLAQWLKKNGFRADQVQTFYPSPMATATAMYHTGKNPLRKITRDSETVDIVRGEKRRRLHKAFLRYHDPNNWPLLREALKTMGRADLIGNGKHHLIPTFQPLVDGSYQSARRKNSTSVAMKTTAPVKGRILTQHTGLPPRDNGSGKLAGKSQRKAR